MEFSIYTTKSYSLAGDQQTGSPARRGIWAASGPSASAGSSESLPGEVAAGGGSASGASSAAAGHRVPRPSVGGAWFGAARCPFWGWFNS